MYEIKIYFKKICAAKIDPPRHSFTQFNRVTIKQKIVLIQNLYKIGERMSERQRNKQKYNSHFLEIMIGFFNNSTS